MGLTLVGGALVKDQRWIQGGTALKSDIYISHSMYKFRAYRTRNERIEVLHERVGILFFSGTWGSVWGSPRRLQVLYLIPGPGVPRNIYRKANSR